jgi:hypothetical protein
VLRKWLTSAAKIEQNYSLIIRPILDLVETSTPNVDDDVQMIASMLTTCSLAQNLMPNESGKLHGKFCVFKIKVNHSKV